MTDNILTFPGGSSHATSTNSAEGVIDYKEETRSVIQMMMDNIPVDDVENMVVIYRRYDGRIFSARSEDNPDEAILLMVRAKHDYLSGDYE